MSHSIEQPMEEQGKHTAEEIIKKSGAYYGFDDFHRSKFGNGLVELMEEYASVKTIQLVEKNKNLEAVISELREKGRQSSESGQRLYNSQLQMISSLTSERDSLKEENQKLRDALETMKVVCNALSDKNIDLFSENLTLKETLRNIPTP
jgi:uncharacterized phage infection (PIP) family protein YhgE